MVAGLDEVFHISTVIAVSVERTGFPKILRHWHFNFSEKLSFGSCLLREIVIKTN